MRQQQFRSTDSSSNCAPPMLDALMRETGQRLGGNVRRLMEKGLAADFGDVVVHTSDLAHRVSEAHGTRAFAVGNHICFSAGAYDPQSQAGLWLIAHELAHVTQKRLPPRVGRWHGRGGRLMAEIEADYAAACVLGGRSHACTVPLPADELSAWGTGGHYYTCYLVLLAAGLPNKRAAWMAFYAQMPDEVKEFDAVEAGFEYYKLPFEDESLTGPAKQQERCLQIQRGLHALTGRSSFLETSIRRQVLMDADSDFMFGLALHPFGDSFAHRKLDDESVMYAPRLGHARELYNVGGMWKKKRLLHHEPDNMYRRRALYVTYGSTLYEIVCEKFPQWRRRIDIYDLTTILFNSAGHKSEDSQIASLRQFSMSWIGEVMDELYHPQNEGLFDWETFAKRYRWKAGVTDLESVRKIARAWSTLSRQYNKVTPVQPRNAPPRRVRAAGKPAPAGAPPFAKELMQGSHNRR